MVGKFERFAAENNLNWLQYEIIKRVLNDESIDHYIDIGLEYNIYNAVEREFKGEKLMGLSPTMYKKFYETFKYLSKEKRQLIELVLMGDYWNASTIKMKGIM